MPQISPFLDGAFQNFFTKFQIADAHRGLGEVVMMAFAIVGVLATLKFMFRCCCWNKGLRARTYGFLGLLGTIVSGWALFSYRDQAVIAENMGTPAYFGVMAALVLAMFFFFRAMIEPFAFLNGLDRRIKIGLVPSVLFLAAVPVFQWLWEARNAPPGTPGTISDLSNVTMFAFFAALLGTIGLFWSFIAVALPNKPRKNGNAKSMEAAPSLPPLPRVVTGHLPAGRPGMSHLPLGR